MMFIITHDLRAQRSTLQASTSQTNLAQFSSSLTEMLYMLLIPSLPLSYSHFSTSTHKPPHVSTVQTDGGMLAPLGSPHGHSMSNMPDRGGNDFFSSGVWLDVFLPMFGERKWALWAAGTSLEFPAPTQTEVDRDRLKIALGAQVSFEPRVRSWGSKGGKEKKKNIWCKMKWTERSLWKGSCNENTNLMEGRA